MIINLISGPRNISTALMYSFAQRKDTTVIDEPFYAYYLEKTGADHPGRDEILQSMPVKVSEILKDIRNKEFDSEIIFVKNMAHHLIMEDRSFMDDWVNVFLIRDPRQLIISFSKVISNPGIDDIGLKRSWELYNESDDAPIVIDSNEILKSPEVMLTLLCEKTGIPMDTAMLSWEPGARPEDGVWARYWYANVHQSVGFGQPKQSKEDLEPQLRPLYEESMKYYLPLNQISLKYAPAV